MTTTTLPGAVKPRSGGSTGDLAAAPRPAAPALHLVTVDHPLDAPPPGPARCGRAADSTT
ncbi:hypothetical protein [Streptomyces sp. NPDC093089]|uniref:hypothetical protein n=1 Tax=Streptomyces sp. NPDC093089 TaxID=3366024 RepID=UPI003806BD09